MSEHIYPTSACLGDILCATSGMALAGIPLIGFETGAAVTIVLSAVFVMFSVHGLFSCLRFRTRVNLAPDHIAMLGPRKRFIQWSKLKHVRLAYYSTRRDRERGWFRLSLLGHNDQKLALDSRLTDFHVIARRAALAAQTSNILPDPATLENFQALGIAIEHHYGQAPP